MGWKLAGAFSVIMVFVMVVTTAKYYLREYASRYGGKDE